MPTMSTMPTQPAADQVIDLDVRSVSKRYNEHGKPFTAVDALSLQVPKGAFCSILGPSGCGKTTLLRMIAGFITPDAGDILIGGASMHAVAPNRRPVNLIFQHLALFPMMTVGENIGYGLTRRGIAKPEIRHRVGDMLERVGLPEAAGKRIDQLSGGQKQRVAIARSLVLEPTLLLLDEPLGALDLKLREQMKLELKQLQAQIGTTFVYITHDQSEALVMSDFIAVMNRGKFEQVGTPQELYYRPTTPFVAGFVGNSNRIDATCSTNDPLQPVARIGNGLALFMALRQQLQPAQTVQLFIRPEAITLATDAAGVTGHANRLAGTVRALLFDGANSTVLVGVNGTDIALHVALPHTGQHADLRSGDPVHLGIDAEHEQAFGA